MSASSADSAAKHSEEAPIDRRSAHVGIVCTHAGEVRPLLKRLDRVRRYSDHGCVFRGGFLNETSRVAVVEASGGFARHRQATEILLREHRPTWIFSLGFSSGLADSLQAGDLSLANEICDTHGNSIPVKCRIPGSARIHIGKHVVTDHRVLIPDEKAALAADTGAIAADLGSMAVAQVCHETGTRFLSIRAIVDALPEQMPEQAAAMAFEPSSRAFGTAVATLLEGIKRARMMHSWRARTLSAADHLDRFTTGIILQLAEKLT